MNTPNGMNSESSNAISPKHPESQSVTEGRGDGVGSAEGLEAALMAEGLL